MSEFATVYVAELTRRLKSKPFLIGLFIGFLAIFFFIKAPMFFSNAFQGNTTVVLLGDPTLTSRADTLLKDDFTIAKSLPQQPVTAALLRRYGAGSAIVLTAHQRRLTVAIFAKDPGAVPRSQIRSDLAPLAVQLATHASVGSVKAMLAIPVRVHTINSKFTSSSQAMLAKGIAYTMMMFLYILILVNSQLVMSSVAEEKTSRIAELLIASVDPVALLAGKIFASATLAFVQLVAWVGVGILASSGNSASVSASDANPFDFNALLSGDVITPILVAAFVIFFIIGFLQLSTLFASAASLINRTEDLGSLSVPLVMPVLGALFIAIAALGAPDAPWAVGVSFVPVLSIFVMFARMAVSNVAIWQVLLSIAINVAALVVIAYIGGKLYRVGMLLYGRTPKLSQVWSILRTS